LRISLMIGSAQSAVLLKLTLNLKVEHLDSGIDGGIFSVRWLTFVHNL
jgi:hypothetical protein